jgi:hypothetical protein
MIVANETPKPNPLINKPSTWTVLTFSVNIPNPIAQKITINAMCFIRIDFIFIIVSEDDYYELVLMIYNIFSG